MTTTPPQGSGPDNPQNPYDPYYRYRRETSQGENGQDAPQGEPTAQYPPFSHPSAQPYPEHYADNYTRPSAQPYGQPYTPWAPYGQYQPQPAPAQRAKPKRRGALVAAGVAAVAALTVAGVALASGGQAVNGTALSLQPGASTGTGSSGTGSSGTGSSGTGSSGSGSSGSGSTTTPGTTPRTTPGTTPGSIPGGATGGTSNGSGSTAGRTATAKQEVGIVDIVSVEGYSEQAAAGTGMILSSDGEILTNNHVIDGATSIKVTVVSTGKTYVAKVVGTSPTNDIAMLKLQNASGLATAKFGDSSSVKVGDTVTGVGNAGGKGGVPSAATGKVTKLNKTITASDEGGANPETLNGVIVTDAPIQAGDSGGPMYDSAGEIVGMDTAASTSGPSVGFAIPIDNAMSIISQIEKGIETSSIHIGYPGFLGILIGQGQTSGAAISNVVTSGPAAAAGIVPGDVITKVNGARVANATQLRKAISAHVPGSKISITYTDQTTGSHTVTVTLAAGPAD